MSLQHKFPGNEWLPGPLALGQEGPLLGLWHMGLDSGPVDPRPDRVHGFGGAPLLQPPSIPRLLQPSPVQASCDPGAVARPCVLEALLQRSQGHGSGKGKATAGCRQPASLASSAVQGPAAPPVPQLPPQEGLWPLQPGLPGAGTGLRVQPSGCPLLKP